MPIDGPVRNDDRGTLIYHVQSPYLSGSNEVEVLLPDSYDPTKRYRVLYVLPVEAGIGGSFGDGLQEVRRLDSHNTHDLICVTMAFDTLPWYGAHATNPAMRHEEHILRVVIPLIDAQFPTLGTSDGRMLLGFSKSGWGAYSLILRNPTVFGYAASWDAPLLAEWPASWGISEHFGSKEAFEPYRVADLLQSHADEFRDRTRLVLLGEEGFGPQLCPGYDSHTTGAHEVMTELAIPHIYNPNLRMPHRWDATDDPRDGWVAAAVDGLMGCAAT
jgi:hypothetical protein